MCSVLIQHVHSSNYFSPYQTLKKEEEKRHVRSFTNIVKPCLSPNMKNGASTSQDLGDKIFRGICYDFWACWKLKIVICENHILPMIKITTTKNYDSYYPEFDHKVTIT